jgi:hypothetical protein
VDTAADCMLRGCFGRRESAVEASGTTSFRTLGEPAVRQPQDKGKSGVTQYSVAPISKVHATYDVGQCCCTKIMCWSSMLREGVRDPCLPALTCVAVVCCSFPAYVSLKQPASLAGKPAVARHSFTFRLECVNADTYQQVLLEVCSGTSMLE